MKISQFGLVKLLFFYVAAILPLIIGVTAFFLLGGRIIETALIVLGAVIFVPLINARLFSHPFLQVLEGEGLPILSLGSSGVIQPYLARPKTPVMSFNIFGRNITQMLSRQAAFSIKPAQSAILEESKDEIVIRIPTKDIETKIFSVLGRPGFIYNEQTETLITKDLLSEKERGLFVDHNALYIVRKIDEVSADIKENADLAIAMLGRKKMNIPPWLIYVLVGGAILVLLWLAWPTISGLMGNIAGVGGKAAGTAGAAVTPIVKGG